MNVYLYIVYSRYFGVEALDINMPMKNSHEVI